MAMNRGRAGAMFARASEWDRMAAEVWGRLKSENDR